ncbi:Peptidylarginine deiminase precursor [Phycisphaerae bacterium RAS1]|nr:Peptidylarginine deiminase precursor [Phycisphaerae bacterium RAS1]
MRPLLSAIAFGILVSSPLSARADEPLLVGDQLVFPSDAEIPRYLTDAERAYLKRFGPIAAPRGTTPPPTGPIHCVAEYEPMAGLLLSHQGSSGWLTILNQVAAKATTAGNALCWYVIDVAGEQTTITNAVAANGGDTSRLRFLNRFTDTIWIRDYGPRYIYEGQCRAIVDHTYNRPRPNDDAFSSWWSTQIKHAFYELPLVHGGGNYQLSALGDSNCSQLIQNENLGLSAAQIIGYWQSYQNVNTTIRTALPTSVDSTQHIDMWMQVCGDRKVVISDWPFNVGSTQDNICDTTAAAMAADGYTVYRVPARSLSGVHYTYTNVVICNNLILVPTYTNATIVAAGHNTEALTAWQTAMPGYDVQQINCQAIVSAAGIMHCIVMHVPAHLGGVNPTAYLKTLRGGEVLTPASSVEIRWISDDDVATANVDLLLSTNGGVSYDTVIASATADDGSLFWTVPDRYTPLGRIKVVARDGLGNTGFDASTGNITINGTPGPLGDMNCDGVTDILDINAFTLALSDVAAYGAAYPNCDITRADCNLDGNIDVLDINPFIAELAGAL